MEREERMVRQVREGVASVFLMLKSVTEYGDWAEGDVEQPLAQRGSKSG